MLDFTAYLVAALALLPLFVQVTAAALQYRASLSHNILEPVKQTLDLHERVLEVMP